jgi:hypothetical protein
LSENNKCVDCKKGILIKSYFDKYGKKIKQFSCGHKHIDVVFNEEIRLTDSIEVRKISRREQIKKKPIYFLISLSLMLLGIGTSVIDYPNSLNIGIIISVLGFALTPITEKREIIKEEKI